MAGMGGTLLPQKEGPLVLLRVGLFGVQEGRSVVGLLPSRDRLTRGSGYVEAVGRGLERAQVCPRIAILTRQLARQGKSLLSEGGCGPSRVPGCAGQTFPQASQRQDGLVGVRVEDTKDGVVLSLVAERTTELGSH